MTQERFNQMMATYEREQRNQPVSGWAREYWENAVARGIFDGTAPRAPLTREQAATVFTRLGLIPEER